MKNIKNAIKSLRDGKFVLMHDHDDREDETDLVIAAEFIKPGGIAQMRKDGGGLICVAVDGGIAEKLGLPFTSDILRVASVDFPVLNHLEANDIPYDERSSFSVTINHRKTFTGITDNDRAFTIREFARLCKDPNEKEFGLNFRSPGHVHLLISSGLENREGHTEMATALIEMAGLTPVAVICEMMDEKTGNSLSRDDVREYSKNNDLVFLEADEVKLSYQNYHGRKYRKHKPDH